MKPEELDALGFQLQHHLKDLLRNVSLKLELASQYLEKNDTAQTQKMISTAGQTTKKLWKLLDGLTGLSRASQSEADETIDMRELVVSLVKRFQPQMDSQKIALVVGPMAQATVDVVLMEEVWKQLIENSMMYSKNSDTENEAIQERKILIDATIGDKKSVFFIENSGPGVPAYMVSQLFSSIIKSENDGSNVGLGLLFCRRVIERMGGRIWHERRGDKTRFSFELPNRDRSNP